MNTSGRCPIGPLGGARAGLELAQKKNQLVNINYTHILKLLLISELPLRHQNYDLNMCNYIPPSLHNVYQLLLPRTEDASEGCCYYKIKAGTDGFYFIQILCACE